MQTARTLFFRMVLRKSSEITNKKTIFSQYNIFYNCLLFQSAFSFLFNHRQRSQSNHEQCGLCCSSSCFLVLLYTHYGPLQYFSTYFRKSKEIGVLRPLFPDYVISCDYVLTEQKRKAFGITVAMELSELFSKNLLEVPSQNGLTL